MYHTFPSCCQFYKTFTTFEKKNLRPFKKYEKLSKIQNVKNRTVNKNDKAMMIYLSIKKCFLINHFYTLYTQTYIFNAVINIRYTIAYKFD